MNKNIVIRAFKSLFLDWIGEILYFPLWWYGKGLKAVVTHVVNSINNTLRDLALPLMMKNIFKPMFGQYDKQGRFISFIMRILMIFGRLIIFIFLLIIYLAILFFWLVLPIFVAYQIKSNFSSLWSQ